MYFTTHVVLFMVVLASVWSSENLILGKPSTEANGNDGTESCFLAENGPVAYWQVDLQGYYDIKNVSITTCWGAWGWKTQSATIEVYTSDPVTCPDAVGFLYGTTPSNTKESENHHFQAKTPFPVRYLRVSATVQPSLGGREIAAFGSVYEKDKVTKFGASQNKQVVSVISTSSASSANECGKKCHVTTPCVAFSFNLDVNDNCVLSDCPTVADGAGWITMVVEMKSDLSC